MEALPQARQREVTATLASMVRACSQAASIGFRFTHAMHMANLNVHGTADSCSGSLCLQIHGLAQLVYVRFRLTGTKYQWREGELTIAYGDNQPHEFICRQDKDLQTSVTPRTILRRQRALRKAIGSILGELGRTPEAIAKRLPKLGYKPDLDGLKQYIAEIVSVRVVIDTTTDAPFLLNVSRGDDPAWRLDDIQLPAVVRQFIVDCLALDPS